MIIKGKSRSGPGALALHLGNAEKNEEVSVIESRGTVATDLRGALLEMDTYAFGTKCTKPLYHAAISPEPPHRLTPEQRSEAVDELEKKLGLEGHPRIVVMHEKLGREHIHVVWARIDTDRMRAVPDSHNYRKHEEVARHLERRFGHDRVQGAHHEREGVERPDRTASRAEQRQEERTGIKGKRVKEEVTAAYRASDTAEAFKAALEDKGYILARGDRRDFVIVDRAGGVHSLGRRIEGVTAAELRDFMKSIDRDALPSADQVVNMVEEHMRQATARAEAIQDSAYSRGEDYVSQSDAALQDHMRRQRLLDEAHREQQEEQKAKEDRESRKREDHQSKEPVPEHSGSSVKDDMISAGAELTDAQQERLDRLLNAMGHRSAERGTEPDRQGGTSGGGRTRSR